MTRKLTVTFDGQTFTRKTARAYSHVILVRDSKEKDLKIVNDNRFYAPDRKNYRYFKACADGTYKFPDFYREESKEELREKGRELIERYPTMVDYIDNLVQRGRDQIEAKALHGGYDKWNVFAWAGRPDLAMAQDSKARSTGRFAEVRMVEVDQS